MNEDGEPKLTGFYTNRSLKAENEESACATAMDLVRCEIQRYAISLENFELTVEEVFEVESFEDQLVPGRGFVFFPEGPESEEEEEEEEEENVAGRAVLFPRMFHMRFLDFLRYGVLRSGNKYRVFICGRHAFLELEEGKPKLFGFHTTRYLKAKDEDDACNVALDLVRREIQLYAVSLENFELTVKEVVEVESFEGQFPPGEGFTFFPEEPAPESESESEESEE